MNKLKKEQKPRWVKREFIWFCNGCKKNKAAAPKVLKIKPRYLLCVDCGLRFLESQKEAA